MSAVTIRQMADRVAQLMEERMAIRGRGLAAKLGRGGNRLPHRVREAAGRLAASASKASDPKLLGQIDQSEVAEAYDICLRHLITVDVADRRRLIIGSVLSAVGFGTLVAGLMVIGFLAWRGYL